MINISIAILFPLLTFGADGRDDSCQKSLHIYYVPPGTISKPYTEIIFYTRGSVDNSYEEYYIYKIEVSEEQFQSINAVVKSTPNESAIKNQSKLEVGLLYGDIEIVMLNCHTEKNLKFKRRETVDKIFTDILSQFNNSPNEKTLYSSMIGLLKRLDISGIADRYKVTKRRRRQA